MLGMPETIYAHPLYQSDLVRVRDVCCRPRDGACGAEESSSSNDIVFPRTGFFVRHIGRREVAADPAGVLFFSRGEAYRVSHPVEGGDDCTSLSFAPEVLAEAFAAHDPKMEDRPDAPFRTASAPCEPGTFMAMHRLRALLRERRPAAHEADTLPRDELALRLLAQVARDGCRDVDTARRTDRRREETIRAHQDLVAHTRVVLSERLGEAQSLPEIARRVHASPYHLARVFERFAGCPIHRYRLQLRLRAALERLAGGEADLTTLAFDLGFSSHSHLTSTFQRAFGSSPARVRAELSVSRLRQMSKKLKAGRPATS